jgi:hypothetical protein
MVSRMARSAHPLHIKPLIFLVAFVMSLRFAARSAFRAEIRPDYPICSDRIINRHASLLLSWMPLMRADRVNFNRLQISLKTIWIGLDFLVFLPSSLKQF